MVKMARSAFLLSLIAGLVVAGCASPPRRAPKETATTTVPARAPSEFERQLKEKMQEEEHIFDELGEKMDAYQNLLVACDNISMDEKDKDIRAACAARLKVMKRELDELSDLLQGKGGHR
ncbi:MAG: hypothetical protein ABSC19_19175 [Syntrophorhabdales bacterium]|jgi:hypothetical protein